MDHRFVPSPRTASASQTTFDRLRAFSPFYPGLFFLPTFDDMYTVLLCARKRLATAITARPAVRRALLPQPPTVFLATLPRSSPRTHRSHHTSVGVGDC